MYRRSSVSGSAVAARAALGASIEVLLVHPGGPFFANKDRGVWSIPKGEVGAGEELRNVARRELQEETGITPPATAQLQELGSVKQAGGKIVHAWSFEGEWTGAKIVSNTFRIEWPTGSGRTQEFPEVDRAAWYSLDEAREKINAAQVFFLDKLALLLEA